MFDRRGVSRGRKWSAAALMLAAAALRAEDSGKPTNREQLKQFHESWVAAGRPSPGATSVRKEWGIDDSDIVNVHAYEFQANTSTDLINDDGNGYRFFGAPAVPFMAAPVRLPSGALINGLSMSYCSPSEGDIVVALYDNGSSGDGGGGGDLIAGPLVVGGECGVATVLANYSYPSNFGHPLYLVVHFAGEATDGTIKFNNVGIRHKRQVSPAPAQATFADVPTNDFGFQYIEALASSGITGGCGGSNYCPDSPVTRRQMAIFLAKALGLHWAE